MFKDKLIFDVPEGPKLGQLKDLKEASDDELVEIGNTAVEVLELRESEEETNLERADQDKLSGGDYTCIDLVLLRFEQYICRVLGEDNSSKSCSDA